MEVIKKIQAVQNTLEKVSVAGPENWNRMLGCWQALQTLQEVEKELMNHESADPAVQQRNTEDAAAAV